MPTDTLVVRDARGAGRVREALENDVVAFHVRVRREGDPVAGGSLDGHRHTRVNPHRIDDDRFHNASQLLDRRGIAGARASDREG